VAENIRSYGNWTGFYTGDAKVFFEPKVVTVKFVLESGSVTFDGLALAGSEKLLYKVLNIVRLTDIRIYRSSKTSAIFITAV
jgi:hypothetical protein